LGRARLCVSTSPFAVSHFSSLFRPVRSEVADREEAGAEEEGGWEDRDVSKEERGAEEEEREDAEEEEREDADAEVDRGVGIGVAGAAAVAGASPAVLAVADFLAGAAFLEAGSVLADVLMVCT
jgi:hypothetical protein